jgi:hypothetical protein
MRYKTYYLASLHFIFDFFAVCEYFFPCARLSILESIVSISVDSGLNFKSNQITQRAYLIIYQ